MKPKPSLLDPRFRYYGSADTNLRRTFARVRREQKLADEQERRVKVTPIRKTNG